MKWGKVEMKDMVMFTHDVLSNTQDLQSIFTKFFDQHVAMYYLTSEAPVSIVPEVNSTTIMYIVKPNKVEELKQIVETISRPVSVYGKIFNPELTVNEDKLYVTLK